LLAPAKRSIIIPSLILSFHSFLQKLNIYIMKKIIFSMLAIAMLSSTAVLAEGGKTKKPAATKSCDKGCPKTKDCGKTAVCPTVPGCVCH
jgi:hypothetical protein